MPVMLQSTPFHSSLTISEAKCPVRQCEVLFAAHHWMIALLEEGAFFIFANGSGSIRGWNMQ